MSMDQGGGPAARPPAGPAGGRLGAGAAAPAARHGMADLLLVNGSIWTGAGGVAGGTPPEVEALAVRDGLVLAAGGRHDVEALAGPGTRLLDLGGRRVVPGLVDAHIHAVRAGLTWNDELRWGDKANLAEALASIRERAAAQAAGTWIRVVGGWHHCQLAERRLPTRAELDAAAPDHPVYVQSLYDAAVLNSAALAACGWDASSADPQGGELERDPATGDLTGVVRGMLAFLHPLGRMPRPSLEQQVASTRGMFTDLARLGMVGVVDPGGIGIPFEGYGALFELWRRGELPLRTRLYYSASEPGNELEQYEGLTRYARPRFGDDLLRVIGVGEIVHYDWHDKGSLSPYDIPERARNEFVEISRLAAGRGWPMHMHAIQRHVVDAVLDAWEQVDREIGLHGRRFSLAHADAIGAAGLARARALDIGIGVQDWLVYRSDEAASAWGHDLAGNAPPLRDMLDAGVPVAAGSDSTRANSENPWLSLWWLVTGGSLDGGPRRNPHHRLARAEALRLYTAAGAWFSFEEGTRGTLEVGRTADAVALSDDYFACDEDAIPHLRADLTLVGGHPVHAGEGFEGVPEAG